MGANIIEMVKLSKLLLVFLLLYISISPPWITFSASSSSSSPEEGNKEEQGAPRSLKQERGKVHEVHCSRERSRAAWRIVEEYLMPFVEKERYEIPERCRLHPGNDMFRDQELHKIHEDVNEWRCGYCKKVFYEEKFLDRHFDNRHYDLLNVNHGRCLADVCGALHCDLMMDSTPRKTKCNPAAAARNKHLCESLSDTCFPVNEGSGARRLNEFFLRQFCDAHTCTGSQKPFSKGGKEKTSILYVIACAVTLMLLALFYLFMYLYNRGIRRDPQGLRRISRSGPKKKPS